MSAPSHYPNQCWDILNLTPGTNVVETLKFVPKGSINNIPDDGLAPTRRQAIIWTDDGYITDAYMRHSASVC